MYSDSKYISNVLGLQATEMKSKKDDSNTRLRNVVLYKLANIGTRIPTLNTVHALYVYADIVEYQHVGDVMAPLIAYVDVTKSPGERVGHIRNPPVYLPVDKSYIDTISIRITDEHGNDIVLSDDNRERSSAPTLSQGQVVRAVLDSADIAPVYKLIIFCVTLAQNPT